MTFDRPLGPPATAAQAPTTVALAAGGMTLFLSLVLAAGVLPAGPRRERAVPLNLAAVSEGTTPILLSAHDIVVSIDRGGAMRLGGREVGLDAIKERLDSLGAAGGNSLTIRADAEAPFGLVLEVLAAGRKAGIRDSALLTVDPAPDGAD